MKPSDMKVGRKYKMTTVVECIYPTGGGAHVRLPGMDDRDKYYTSNYESEHNFEEITPKEPDRVNTLIKIVNQGHTICFTYRQTAWVSLNNTFTYGWEALMRRYKDADQISIYNLTGGIDVS